MSLRDADPGRGAMAVGADSGIQERRGFRAPGADALLAYLEKRRGRRIAPPASWYYSLRFLRREQVSLEPERQVRGWWQMVLPGSGGAPPDVQLGGGNRHVHRAALAIHEHQHRCAFGVFVHSRLEVVYRANRLTIDLDDHVTGADAGLAGAAPLNDVTHQHALVHLEAELAGDRRGERLNRKTQLALALDPGDLGRRFVLEPGDPRGAPYLFALPHHHHRHLAAHPRFGDEARQVRGLRNLLPGELHDHVPGFHTGLLRRGALHHGRDQRAGSVGALEALGELLGEGLDRHTEPAALDLAV